MVLLLTKNEYINEIKTQLRNGLKELQTDELLDYINNLFQQLDGFIENISKESFWDIFPRVLGVDAKLMLLSELIKLDNLATDEIIRLTEKDYLHYLKELCGYNLNEKTNYSLVFNIK